MSSVPCWGTWNCCRPTSDVRQLVAVPGIPALRIQSPDATGGQKDAIKQEPYHLEQRDKHLRASSN